MTPISTLSFARPLLVTFSSLLLAASGSLVGAQTFTLSQVMSAPFSSGLIAAPKGGDLVWLMNREGRRNLWVAEVKAGGYTARPLTKYGDDDGVDIGDVTWTPDGTQVVYARGGDFEFPERPSPNPALLPGGVDEVIWIVPAAGGEPRKLAEGRAPAISPDGRTMAFVSKDQIWTLDLRTKDAKPVQLLHGRGTPGSLLWSPDGKMLAFTSARGDHGFVGVYAVSEKSLRYLDPSTEIDRDPVWSPDSRQVAFVRIPPDTSGESFKARREAEPWSIRVADASTGDGHEVWHAAKGPGSVFHEVVAEHQVWWSAGGQLVFPWEGDGWQHLYAVAQGGGASRLLTPGAFEVEHVSLSPDHTSVIYSSNQDDIDRKHVWEVAVAAGEPRQLTRGEGIELSPVMTQDGAVAVLRSDARVPMRPAVVSSAREVRDVAPELIPAGFPAAALVVPQPVIFPAADGMAIHGQLFLPKNLADGQRHPAVVFFHGGSRRQMLLGWSAMYYYSNAYAMNQYLASQGYIVLSVNYRSGIGYGLNFREALNYGAAGASEFNDVLGAGLYLRGRADVDGAHIGAWGGSYGGYLTALALARSSDLFAAGVDLHGVHDWNLELGNWQPTYNPASDPEGARIAWESSPLASMKTWRSPVLLIQGDDDRNVQFSNTVRLAAALRTQGVPFEEHVFPDEIHDFLLWRDWVTAYTLGVAFFDGHLKTAH